MKITQLDYTAIRSANAAQAQANQMKINVEDGTRRTQLTRYDVDTTDRYIKAVRTERRNKSILDTVMGVVDIGLEIAGSAIDAKNKADAEESTYAMTQFSNDLDQRYTDLIRSDASAFYDEDNNLKVPDVVDSWKQEMLSQIDGMNVSNAYKDQMRTNLDRLFEIGQSSAVEQLTGREFENTLMTYDMSREDALKVDTSQPDPSPSQGYALIDGAGWMTPQEKATAKAQYDKDFTARVQSNTAAEIARSKGADEARGYVDSLGLDEEDSSTLYALIGDVVTQTEASADAKVRRDIAFQLDNGIHPVVARTRVESEIEKMPEYVQESATHELDLAIYANGLKMMGITSDKDISSYMGDELMDLQNRLDRGGEAYFPGLENEVRVLKGLVSEQYSELAASDSEANIKTQDLNFSMWQQGLISWRDCYNGIMRAQNLNGDGKDVEHAGSLIDRMQGAYVPDVWKDYNKNREEGLKDLIEQAASLDIDDPEDKAVLDQKLLDARASVLSYFANTPAEKMTQEGIDAAYQRATENVIGETITSLERIEETGRTLVQQGAQELNLGNLTEVTSLMMSAPEGAIRVETVNDPGQKTEHMAVYFGEDTYQRMWSEEVVLTVDAVRDGGLGDIEGHRIEPLWVGDEESGRYVPIPVMTLTNDDKYMVYGESVWKMPKGGGGWTPDRSIRDIPGISEKYFRPEPAYEAPVSTEAPMAAPLGDDGFLDQADEREMTPDEWRFTNYLESLEEEEPEDSARLAPASSLPESVVVETDAKEPEIPARIVNDYLTEFWYKGRWYDVALLPEGNEVTAAYDRFNASYEGDFPEVRR